MTCMDIAFLHENETEVMLRLMHMFSLPFENIMTEIIGAERM